MTITWRTIGKYALQFAEYALAQKFAPQMPQAPAPTPAPAPPTVPAPEPVAPTPVDRTAAIRQFVIDTYMHSAPQGLNRANEADISAVELADGIAKVQKYGTHALQREMYTRNGIHDDQMPQELLVNNPL